MSRDTFAFASLIAGLVMTMLLYLGAAVAAFIYFA
jgi:hypothetical protein